MSKKENTPKTKKDKSNTKKVIIFVAIIIVIMIIVACVLIFLTKGDSSDDGNENVKVQLSALEEYGYTLDDADTELFKTEFNILKENLESDEVDFEEYAKSLAKLFIIDLYTIDNKINKYDVGGSEYVYPDVLDNYKLNVEDTIYKYVEDNSKGKRDQSLPEVASIEITSCKSTTFNYKPDSDSSVNKTLDAYEIEYSVTYKSDMDYDESGTVTIVKEDNKLYVIAKE